MNIAYRFGAGVARTPRNVRYLRRRLSAEGVDTPNVQQCRSDHRAPHRTSVVSLVDEFGDRYPRPEIERLVRDSLGRLLPNAEVNDFVPTLAYRFARQRLLASDHRIGSGTLEILFVGLGDSRRVQMAAALMALRSEGRIAAHSAGSTASDAIDPAVTHVMAELDVDMGEAYAKPLTTRFSRLPTSS